MLNCHQRAVTCPDSPVSCECQGFVFHRWFAGTEEVFELSVNDEIGVAVESTVFNVLYHGVVCSADTTGVIENRVLVTRLNFTFTNRVDLICVDVIGPIMTTLQEASRYGMCQLLSRAPPPSPPPPPPLFFFPPAVTLCLVPGCKCLRLFVQQT